MELLHNKKKLILLLFFALYYIVLFNYRFCITPDYGLSPIFYPVNANSIVVREYGSTGPTFVVTSGRRVLKAAIHDPKPKDLDTKGIELQGINPCKYIIYPDTVKCRYLLKGEVVGLSDHHSAAGFGTIPVFEVKEAYPIATLPDYLFMDGRKSSLTINLIIFLLIFGIPVLVIFCVYLVRIKKREGVSRI